MTIRTLDDSPSLGGLYARALMPSIPGLSALRDRMAGVDEDRGGDRVSDVAGADVGADRDASAADQPIRLPDLEVRLPDISIDADHLARYRDVCGFGRAQGVPATYPYVLAFPLQLLVMTEPDFPFPVLGMVHVGNRIEQRRPLTLDDTFELRVRAEGLRPHRRGTQLTLVSEAVVADEVLWRDESVALRRHAVDEVERGTPTGPALPDQAPAGPVRWQIDGGLGRRYARVSGDRNPIHLSALSARAFGFRRPIAHGMWTKAKSLASLEQRVPEAFAVDVAFRKPILLPGDVSFGARDTAEGIEFGVTSGSDRTHLVGRLTPS